MNYLYYCNSPYQLFNVINLNWHRKYENFEKIEDYNADLIVLNTFSNADKIVNALKKSRMFSDVVLSERFNNEKTLHTVKSFLDIVFPKRFLKKSHVNEKYFIRNQYDVLCIPKISKIVLSFWSLNSNANIELYEEGIATYFGGSHMCVENGNHETLYSMLNKRKKLLNSFRKIYINDPGLYLDNDINKLVKIPKISNECIIKCKRIFKDILFEDKASIYWIGQYGLEDINKITENVLLKNRNMVVYCPHPRFKQNESDIFRNINNSFWEMNISKFNDINNKLLITVHSTASISPKLLYGYEPYLILTMNMINKDNKNKNAKLAYKVIEKFVSSYSDKSKIMLPNSEEELKECIDIYVEKLSNALCK